MAQGVVDVLEVVDVQQDQGHRLPEAPAARGLGLGHAVQVGAVPRAGQRIGRTGAFQFRDPPVQLVDAAAGACIQRVVQHHEQHVAVQVQLGARLARRPVPQAHLDQPPGIVGARRHQPPRAPVQGTGLVELGAAAVDQAYPAVDMQQRERQGEAVEHPARKSAVCAFGGGRRLGPGYVVHGMARSAVQVGLDTGKCTPPARHRGQARPAALSAIEPCAPRPRVDGRPVRI